MTVIEQDTMHAIQSACRKYAKEKKEIDWEQRRYEIAKDVLCGMVSAGYIRVKEAVVYAGELIEELKKKGE